MSCEVALLAGDCLERMGEMPDASIDAVVCDPPYALPGGFMGKTWDRHDGREDAALAYYLCGLIDGEGHFAIKQHTRGTHAPAFVLKVRADEEGGLRRIVRDVGFGSVTIERRPQGNDMVKWSVQSKEDCQRLVDLLDKYGLRLKKRLDYELWRQAVCEWTARPRGNRWHGSSDDDHMAGLRRRLMESRAYVEPPWSGHEYQDWCRLWGREAFRVLKPGGHLLAFGGTRTYHRLAAGLEDAGFEIRDTLAWMYGSGFPKSKDVARAIDDRHGVEGGWRREDHPGRGGAREQSRAAAAGDLRIGQLNHRSDDNPDGHRHVYEPTTEEARRWQGWGTALKPAFEPVVVARKPLAGTVAETVERFGTGGLNVDVCRLPGVVQKSAGTLHTFRGGKDGYVAGTGAEFHADGRWPANVALGHSEDCVLVGTREVRGDGHTPASRPSSTFAANAQPESDERAWDRETVEDWECVGDCPVRLLDEQTGELKSGALKAGTRRSTDGGYGGDFPEIAALRDYYGDSGGASRFFYCAKTSRAERSAGLGDDFAARMLRWSSGDESPGTFQAEGTERNARNHHPTVKPISLMRWLIRLVTPPGGTVLDPFVGSGSTGCAAVLEPCVGRFVGIERDPDYLSIAEARVAFWRDHGEGALDVVRAREQGERQRRELEDAGQLDLFEATT